MAVQSSTSPRSGTKIFGTTPTLTASSDSALTVAFMSWITWLRPVSGGEVHAFAGAFSCHH
ncbi:MAG: hypothetical protein F2892_05875 [Actinobacteria bacterium]|nr:hypothetical protein [Actinomycetota bacterium]